METTTPVETLSDEFSQYNQDLTSLRNKLVTVDSERTAVIPDLIKKIDTLTETLCDPVTVNEFNLKQVYDILEEARGVLKQGTLISKAFS